jgi:hypothetical protein
VTPLLGESVQRFERFEFKYWAPRTRVDAALRLLEGFMQEDEVARQKVLAEGREPGKSGASQVNTSLYLDSPRFTFLEQHLSGSPDRIKLRVRYYGLRPTGDCFFEIKRRQNAVVMKKRAVLGLEATRPFLLDVSQALPAAVAQNEAMQNFQYLALRCQAEPKLLVRAKRAAYRAVDAGVDVRVTVDTEIAWQPPRGPDFLEPREGLWRYVGGDQVASERALVEVKFRDSRPWWLGEVVQLLGPFRVSFSKYVAAAIEARKDPFFTSDAA